MGVLEYTRSADPQEVNKLLGVFFLSSSQKIEVCEEEIQRRMYPRNMRTIYFEDGEKREKRQESREACREERSQKG